MDLYNLASGQWRTITPSQKLGCTTTTPAAGTFPTTCTVVGAGRYWLKVNVQYCPGGKCPDRYWLQNIYTGAVKRDPAKQGGRLFDDLNAPPGTAPLCTPLRYPTAEGSNYQPEPGSLTFYGQFAIANQIRLERCHSRMNLLINRAPIFGTSRALIWSGHASPVGLFLPSLQRFTVPLAKTVIGTVAALTLHTIYVSGPHGVWAATFPKTPLR